MINFTSGNILESQSEAIVNTVNCEGFMGKGIAYQFKVKFPENNIEYAKLCRNNQFNIGDIFLFKEDEKIILNFPTKDKWRKKSEYDFIKKGLITLKEKIISNNINSVSIPPLGCGNGGLKWDIVKEMILDSLKEISNETEVLIYEPLYSPKSEYKTKIKKAPKLSTSHFLLMQFKTNLTKFNKIRLQKSIYLNNIISGHDYFKFKAQNYGPYAHSIDILSRDIKEYQNYHNVTTEKAIEKSRQVLISKNFKAKMNNFAYSFEKTIDFVNKISEDSKLELLTTILFIIDNNVDSSLSSIVKDIENWNEHKRLSFNKSMIEENIFYLLQKGIINKTLYDTYEIKKTTPNTV